MNTASSQQQKKQWRRMGLFFLSLLPILAIFHLVMWFGFTRTLFRPETGDLKRLGYLVGLEDCMRKLRAEEKQTGQPILGLKEVVADEQIPAVIFGDSFATSLAKAYRARSGQRVVAVPLDWEQGNGLAQIKNWLAEPWFHAHGVKTVIVERVEYAWLDTFADEGNPALNIPWSRQLLGEASAINPKAPHWTFANNGNFKVLFCNLGYLFSPTAFKMSDACVVRLKQKFFTCSYGDRLLFYRGDFHGAQTDGNQSRVDQALRNTQELSEFCRAKGFQFQLLVPPVKSYLYYDWVERPFYHDSKLLETLQGRVKDRGYVDLRQVFHQRLAAGYQDLYYPDDLHWNYPAAEMAAEELVRAEKRP